MAKYLLPFSFFIYFPLNAGTHWDEEQVSAYVHHSELQRRSSWQLLSQIQFSGNEHVLDVGCGDGRNTAWLAMLVRKGEVIGIDPTHAMIDWAKKQYHPQEFPNLLFFEGDANNIPDATFDVISSLFSLHMVSDKQAAIQNFHDHLSEGGRVIAVIPPISSNPEFGQAVVETMQAIRWKGYFNDFTSTFKQESLQNYIQYFQNSGFTILHAKYAPSVDPFVNKTEAIEWFKGTWPHMNYVPKELCNEFFGEIIDRYIEKRPDALSSEGVIYFYWGRYELIAQKI